MAINALDIYLWWTETDNPPFSEPSSFGIVFLTKTSIELCSPWTVVRRFSSKTFIDRADAIPRFQIPPTFSKIDCHIPSAAATSLEPTFDCDSSIEAVDKSSVADEIEFSSSSTVMIVKSLRTEAQQIWWTYQTWSSVYFQRSERPVDFMMAGEKDAFALVSTSCCTCPSEKKTTSGELSNLNRSYRTIQWMP